MGLEVKRGLLLCAAAAAARVAVAPLAPPAAAGRSVNKKEGR